MLIHLFSFFAACSDYYTALNGADNDFCHLLQPCSFERVVKKVRPKDIIFIKGDYIGEPDDLEKARVLFNSALAQGVIVASDNMTINGTKLQNVGFSFIVVQSTEEPRIHSFHFTGFSCSIACFRTVEKGVISNSYFTHNHVKGGIGLLSFGVGKCKLDECVLVENTVLNSSLISMFSTHLYLNMTLIERNFVKSNSRQALLFAINSVCEYTNTTIRFNSSPHSPLHQFEFRSCFGFWNCTFEFNKHPETMLCDGTCEFNFTNTTISNNMGSFLTTSVHSVVSFNESSIINNFSGDRPLFYLPGSEFYILHPCFFIENHGTSILDTRGMKSLINLTNAQFIGNNVDEFVIGVDESSKVVLNNCKFKENFALKSSIYSKKSYLEIQNSSFRRNKVAAIKMKKGKAHIFDSKFMNNIGSNDDSYSILSHGSTLSVSNSYFQGSSPYGHINATGKVSLFQLSFSGMKKYSLRGSIRSSCILCSYNVGKVKKPKFYFYFVHNLTGLMIMFTLVSIILLFLFYSFDYLVKRKCRMNYQNLPNDKLFV
ncbi:hypothetical protein TRFO_34156 [Tritrichomonas foetus]|uniref:Right handed beta helix domain-containing protein n=1 Tax=Tritrichomonas foetus TaxID=1144522 RepID=A0A1J4JPE4_9EUKA|nr:hypothetical protein TRFO_34156 [Tritrichomonas foetus]|eukprot:OHS99387.1 hypothetical protein TRFO_34156 [Tritrichomonas foetus]